MKKFIFAYTLLTVFLHHHNNLQGQNQQLIKSIVYDVPLINEELLPIAGDTNFSETCWWTNNLEPSRRWFLQQTIIRKVATGKISVFNENGQMLSKKELDKIMIDFDSLTLTKTYPPYDTYDTVIANYIQPSSIRYLRFKETWYYDAKSFKIIKGIISYAPIIVEYSARGVAENRKPLFWIKCNDKSLKTKGYKELTDFIGYKCSFSSVNLLSAMQNNFGSVSDDTLSQTKYSESLFHAAITGNITVYDPEALTSYFNYTEDNVPKIPPKDLEHFINKFDTVVKLKEVSPYDNDDTVRTYHFDFRTMTAIDFYEKWFFNPATMEIKKKIISISPCLMIFDDRGEFKGFRPLFSVLFMKPFRCF